MGHKKYEFTGETRVLSSSTLLYRIRALIDMPSIDVRAGDIGGWIESESNLSHEGHAWVNREACVFGNARVYNNAAISGNAMVFENARVFDNAYVASNAKVSGNAQVYKAALVYDNARIYGNARVDGYTWIYGNALVYGNAHIYGNAWVSGHAEISGCAQVCGNVRVYNNAQIDGNVLINSNRDFISIGPIGSRNDSTTFFKNVAGNVCVKCGCFLGTVDEFLAAVQKTHGDNWFGREYRIATELAKAHILGRED